MHKTFVLRMCDECKRMIDMAVGQSLDSKTQLIWWGAYSCPYCGSQVELDGIGVPEDDIKSAIIRTEGEWALIADFNTPDIAKVLSILKHALNLSMPEVSKLKKLFPGEVYKGTKTEVKRLKMLLERQGINLDIKNISKD